MIAWPCAAGHREPRQVRKEATVSGTVWAPQVHRAGVGCCGKACWAGSTAGARPDFAGGRGHIGKRNSGWGPIRKETQKLYTAAQKLAVQSQRLLNRLPNGHLHLGLIGALIASSLIAIVIPISRSQASESHAHSAVEQITADTFLEQARATPAPTRATLAPVTLHVDGLVSNWATRSSTVGSVLEEAGVQLNDADIVAPARETEVSPGMHVFVTHARRIELDLGSSKGPLFTQAKTVEEALLAAGYDLQPRDWVFPSRTAPVRDGMIVQPVMIRDANEPADEPIAHSTEYRYDATLPKGQQVVNQAGVDGNVHREYSVHRMNGQETSRRLLSETKVAPTPAIVTLGSYVAPTPTPTTAPDGSQCSQTMTVWSTFYTAASAGGSTTRTGTGVYKGIVAVDPRVIPLGTRMYIPGYGFGLAADTGGGVKGNWLDVAYGPGDTVDWYSHYVDICILG